MNVARHLAELAPTIRWHRGKLWTDLVLRRAFGHLGADTVFVAPETLRNVQAMSIGDRCVFQERAWLACEAGTARITVGDDSVFGRDCHLHAGSDIRIGRNFHVGPRTVIISATKDRLDLRHVLPAGPIRIGDDVWVGEGSAILGGVTIGSGATIGAGSVVTRDVAPGVTVAGTPARELRPAVIRELVRV